MFDILIYTDCAEGESLNGRTGFQFTAASPGAGPADQDVVRQRLQHAVPISIPPADWERHPPTCAFVVTADRMYLSRGRSTGATLSGRPGNQLTETVMTSDAYDILPLRPAQLYSAPDWSLERPPTREVQPWNPPLEIAPPFDIPALHELVARDPWAAAALPAFLTMIEQTQGESRVRVIIMHRDQELVMRWIALASWFLEPEAALRLEFRVFAEDPMSTSAHVVGAHPDLSPNLKVARSAGSGVNILDLESREHTPIEPSITARRHATWFLDGDPFEALDAIEVSNRWREVMDPELAVRGAEIACLSSSRAAITAPAFRTVLDVLLALSGSRADDELEAYGDHLVDSIASFAPNGPDDLLSIVDVLWALQVAGHPTLASGLALACLEWAAAQPAAASAWARAGSSAAALEWADEPARAHAANLLATILGDSSADDLDALFILGVALATGVRADQLDVPIGALADLWLAQPDLASRAGRWLHADAIYADLRRRLALALARGDSGAIHALKAGQWDWMLPATWSLDPAEPMSIWLGARALKAAPPEERAAMLSSAAASVSDGGWSVFLDTGAAPDPREIGLWIRARGTIAPDLAERIEYFVGAVEGRESWEVFGADLLHSLAESPPSGVSAGLNAILADHRRIEAWFAEALASPDSRPSRPLTLLTGEFSGDRRGLYGLYGPWITRCLIACSDVDAAVALTKGRGASIAALLTRRLESGLRAGDPDVLMGGLALYAEAPDHWSSLAKSALDGFWDDASTEPIRARLAASLPAGWAESLEAYVRDQGKGRIGRGVLRAARSVFQDKKR